MRAVFVRGSRVASQFGLCGTLLLLASVSSHAQVVSLSSYNSLAAWEAAAAGLPASPLIPLEDFNSVTPGSFDPLNPFPYQVGLLSIDFNLIPPNTFFNIGGGHPAYYIDGSPALRGNFIDPTESLVITFPEPVFGFAFKIQRPSTPASFPALAVSVQGTPAPPITAVAPPDGFYGIVDTGGGSFQSITLSRLSAGQSFNIDDFYFLVPDEFEPGNVIESEPNNTIATAQNIDPYFSLGFSPDIGNETENTSTLIPHVTIDGLGNDTFDYYSFTVDNAGDVGIFDIDYADGFDSYLRLYNSGGTLLSFGDDSETSWGQSGSESGLDSYLEYTFDSPGTYAIEVGRYPEGSPVPAGASYQLQVSIGTAPFDPGPGDPEIRNWTNSAGGVFGVGSNWNSGVPPDANDTANFNLPGETFTVDFNADAESFDMRLRNGNVTFDLNGNTYHLTDTGGVQGFPNIAVGDANGDNATLTITGGGLLEGYQGYIGSSSGSQGMVIVTGDDSTWWNSTHLSVGFAGTGELTVADGGFVWGTFVVIGNQSGSEGLVTVTGEGSRLEGYTILVGSYGSGTLRVENGATVDTLDFIASINSLEGDGTIFADSVMLDGVDLMFDSTHGLQQTFGFGDGGQINLNKNNLGTLGAGYKEAGTLTIAEGFTVTSEVGTVGALAGSQGIATVTGGSSTWNISYSLNVGYAGAGELNIEDGGKIFSGGGGGSGSFIGGEQFSNTSSGVGKVTVTGPSSAWINSTPLTIGYSGDGELTIENGGAVSNTDGYIGRGNHANSNGTVTVTGAGSTWTNTGNLILSGTSLTTSTTGDSSLTVGDGGTVTVTGTTKLHANATVTVDGGTLRTGSLDRTTGTFHHHDGNVEIDGGTYTQAAGALVVSGNTPTAQPSFQLSEDATTSNIEAVIIGSLMDQQGELLVKGGSTLTNSGTGSLGAIGSITVFRGSSYLGLNADSFGKATVTGEGSTWTSSDSLIVGRDGMGELTIAEGGVVSVEFGSIGYGSGSHGTATVIGQDSTWDLSDGSWLEVGRGGTGELTIVDGGAVTSRQGIIGSFTASQGTVIVTGEGSNWTTTGISSSFVSVGYEGTGELTIENGGSINSVGAYVGHFDGAQGTATVTGTGSTWTSTANFVLGGFSGGATTAAGSLTVSDGGTVNVADTLRIHGGGTVNLQPGGTINTQHIGPINGTFNFTGGTLAITGDLTGDLNVPQLGTLKGSGTVLGDVNNSGLVAPGFSPEILHIDGDYTQTSTGRLEIEIGGLTPGTQHDQLQITGTANLAGQLKVSLIDGYLPSVNDEIIAIQAASINGTFSSIAPPVLDPEGNIAVEYVYNLTDMRIRFVGADNTVQFVNTGGTNNWANPFSWSTGIVPGSPNDVTLLANAAERLEVKEVEEIPGSGNAYVHRAHVSGTASNSMTLAIYDNFSATTTLSASNNGVIELNDGNITATSVNIQGGGAMTGMGTVNANVSVGAASGEAVLSPGLSGNGHLGVTGNYQQGTNGTLLMDVAGDETGEFDTVSVSGALQLGGTLRIDATNLTMPAPGTMFDLIAAGSLDEGEIFNNVETIGNDDVFFAPIYSTGFGPGSGNEGGSGGSTEPRVAVGVYYNGDMNRNGLIDTPDVQAFALALTKPINYFSSFYIFGSESGDLNHDGRLDFDDIEFFAALMQGTGATMGDISRAIERELAVPEPNSVLLIVCGLAVLIITPSYRFRFTRIGSV